MVKAQKDAELAAGNDAKEAALTAAKAAEDKLKEARKKKREAIKKKKALKGDIEAKKNEVADLNAAATAAMEDAVESKRRY